MFLLSEYFDTYYLVSRIGGMGSDQYQVAKFSNSKEPDDVYEVGLSKNSDWCSCLGYARSNSNDGDKHTRIVRAWIEAGSRPGAIVKLDDEDEPYVDKTSAFESYVNRKICWLLRSE